LPKRDCRIRHQPGRLGHPRQLGVFLIPPSLRLVLVDRLLRFPFMHCVTVRHGPALVMQVPALCQKIVVRISRNMTYLYRSRNSRKQPRYSVTCSKVASFRCRLSVARTTPDLMSNKYELSIPDVCFVRLSSVHLSFSMGVPR
jgi:hypothetical protein